MASSRFDHGRLRRDAIRPRAPRPALPPRQAAARSTGATPPPPSRGERVRQSTRTPPAVGAPPTGALTVMHGPLQRRQLGAQLPRPRAPPLAPARSAGRFRQADVRQLPGPARSAWRERAGPMGCTASSAAASAEAFVMAGPSASPITTARAAPAAPRPAAPSAAPLPYARATADPPLRAARSAAPAASSSADLDARAVELGEEGDVVAHRESLLR